MRNEEKGQVQVPPFLSSGTAATPIGSICTLSFLGEHTGLALLDQPYHLPPHTGLLSANHVSSLGSKQCEQRNEVNSFLKLNVQPVVKTWVLYA